jgi:hypothetical protein
MSEAVDYMGSRFALLGRLRHSRMRIVEGSLSAT